VPAGTLPAANRVKGEKIGHLHQHPCDVGRVFVTDRELAHCLRFAGLGGDGGADASARASVVPGGSDRLRADLLGEATVLATPTEWFRR
jgi:hypothetical protein